ncbi:acyl-CoA thioesterase [Spirillospora sp. CA-294931]|uniref:acyl-CoA thioesterase n=1 Tax=Spirillospora sp. CA-294931 TaxID=3240042 RepID=UPI003D8EE874
MTFSVRVTVRGYELDTQGHLNGSVYHQYCEHSRWECLRAAGIPQDALLATGVGPVILEETIRFHRELRGGDEAEVTCEFRWREGKTFTMVHEIRRVDGTLCAKVTTTGGLLDLGERRLIPDPVAHWRKLAREPEIMNL